MDKIAKLIFLFSVAFTMALVMGNKDEDPLRNLFAGPNIWAPLMKWNRGAGPSYDTPDAGSLDYGEYDQPDQQQQQQLDGGTVVAKRSHHPRQPICEVLLNIVYVGNGTDGYEYRPNHYVTESCLSTYNTYQNKCTETGLSCTQIRQKVYITRRKVPQGTENKQAVNCWEHVALKEIDAGCECMWPKEQIGDKHSYRVGK